MIGLHSLTKRLFIFVDLLGQVFEVHVIGTTARVVHVVGQLIILDLCYMQSMCLFDFDVVSCFFPLRRAVDTVYLLRLQIL